MHAKIAMKSGILTMANHTIFSKCMSGMHKLKILMRGAIEKEMYILEMIVFFVIAPCNNSANNIHPWITIPVFRLYTTAYSAISSKQRYAMTHVPITILFCSIARISDRKVLML